MTTIRRGEGRADVGARQAGVEVVAGRGAVGAQGGVEGGRVDLGVEGGGVGPGARLSTATDPLVGAGLRHMLRQFKKYVEGRP